LRAGTISLKDRRDLTLALRSTSINEGATGHHTLRGFEAQETLRIIQEHIGLRLRLVNRHPKVQ
jgi:hypothetical protein